jgi:predicted RNA-binding protein with PUA-like domain
MPNHWLFKTEPSVYSFQQLQKDKKTVWDGVANNLALKNLKDIKKGDLVFIYHTGDEKAAVGVAKALGSAYPDPSKNDPKLLVVDVEAGKPLAKPVTLAAVKAHPKLNNFDLVRNSRLSIIR